MPGQIEPCRSADQFKEGGCLIQSNGLRWDESPADQMIAHRRERMQEERREFVQTVKDQRVVPHDDGRADGPHGQREVAVKPGQIVPKERGLDHAGDVEHVAKVQHEEVMLVGLVHEVSDDEEHEHEPCVEGDEPRGVTHDEELREHNGDHSHRKGNLAYDIVDTFFEVVDNTVATLSSILTCGASFM